MVTKEKDVIEVENVRRRDSQRSSRSNSNWLGKDDPYETKREQEREAVVVSEVEDQEELDDEKKKRKRKLKLKLSNEKKRKITESLCRKVLFVRALIKYKSL